MGGSIIYIIIDGKQKNISPISTFIQVQHFAVKIYLFVNIEFGIYSTAVSYT